MPTMVLTCGLPGAGKSYWAERQRGYDILSMDAIRKAGANPRRESLVLQKRVAAHLARGSNVIVDICALRRIDRANWLRIGRDHRARCELVVFHTPLSVCQQRDRRRGGESATGRGYDWARNAGYASEIDADDLKREWDRVTCIPQRDSKFYKR